MQDPYTVQIQPRKHAQDHADYTAPALQLDLDRTDQLICSVWQISIDHVVGVDDLAEV